MEIDNVMIVSGYGSASVSASGFSKKKKKQKQNPSLVVRQQLVQENKPTHQSQNHAELVEPNPVALRLWLKSS